MSPPVGIIARTGPFAIAFFVLGLFALTTRPLVESSRAEPDTTLVSGVDYVAGAVILAFNSFDMPPPEQMVLAEGQFGIDSLDTFLATHEVSLIRPFFSSSGVRVTEAGQRLERTFLIQFDGAADAQAIAETLSTYPQFEYARKLPL